VPGYSGSGSIPTKISDNYTIVVNCTKPWADTSSVPVNINLNPGEKIKIAIPVNVSLGAEADTIESLSLRVYSSSIKDLFIMSAAVFTITNDLGFMVISFSSKPFFCILLLN